MDVRLPVQLGRPLKVALPMGRVAPFGQAAAIDAFFTASLFGRQIRRLLPRLAGLLEPLLRRGARDFDEFLERDQDRVLFVLPPKVVNPQVGGP